MIIKEFFKKRNDGVKLFRTYSDNNKMIVRNDGVEFVEAIDIEDSNYTYTESEKNISHEITDEEAEEMQTAELEEEYKMLGDV